MFRAGQQDQVVECMQVFTGRAPRYRNAPGTEGSGLAEVNVRDDQHALARPERGLLRQ
jgi:hypothetical protein